MKQALLTIVLFFSLLTAFGQNDKDSGSVFQPIHVLPKFPGGIDSLNSFIRKNLRCPKKFKSEGRVIIDFIVETDGTLSNVKYSKRLTRRCDKEAMRVFRRMPKWIPATEFGKPRSNNYYIHFYFKCN